MTSNDALLAYLRDRGLRLRRDLETLDPQSPETTARVAQLFGELLTDLEQLELVGEANRLPSNELWNTAADLLRQGWLQERARMKPRGYAGDYELLQRMLDRQIVDHPWGRHFDAFFQEQAAPQAVRNRVEVVAAAIVDGVRLSPSAKFKFVSIGSGPAGDVVAACSRLSADERSRLHVVLLDLDPYALDFAQRRLTDWLPPDQWACVRENLFRLPQSPRASSWLAEADLVGCTGFCDYLAPADVSALLQVIAANLRPERGRGLVFNFSPANPTRPYMEWIGNWYLRYRTRDELATIADEAGLFPQQWQCNAEPLGINLFLDVRRLD